MTGELAEILQAWRRRRDPHAAGLPAIERGRRIHGLRRQELADLASISVDYVVRLEQGRARRPSASVVDRLSQALALSPEERDHLHLLAGLRPISSPGIPSDLPSSVRRVVSRLDDVPIQIIDPAWTVLHRNAAGAALLGELADLPPESRNIAWRQFTDQESPFVRDRAQTDLFEREVVADLRRALTVHAADARIAELVARLRSSSPRFEDLWRRHEVDIAPSMTKTIRHDAVGLITVECDVLTTERGLRVVLYSADPGSPDARALALVVADRAPTT